MQAVFQILMVFMFVAAIIVCPIAWFRMVKARTRSAYWGNMGLFAGLILSVFVLAELAGFETGLGKSPPPPRPDNPSFQDLVGQMPTIQIVLLSAAALLWIGGGNVLFYFHHRRLGKRWWQILNPLDPPFKDFNGREWAVLVALAVLSLALGQTAISVAG